MKISDWVEQFGVIDVVYCEQCKLHHVPDDHNEIEAVTEGEEDGITVRPE